MIKRSTFLITLMMLVFLIIGCTNKEKNLLQIHSRNVSSDDFIKETAYLDNDIDLLAIEEISIINKKDISEYIIFIDPGHQLNGNYSREPLGPNSTETKPRVASGTKGVATGKYEYELVLEVALKLKDKFESKGYQVYLSRETHDVDISNVERARMANELNADVCIKIHADGFHMSSAQGISVLHPSLSNTFLNKGVIKESILLARLVLEEMVAATNARNRGIVPRDDISGFNWSEVPVVLIEMGFMTNPDEDKKMSTEEYQLKLVEGIFKGVERYIHELDKAIDV